MNLVCISLMVLLGLCSVSAVYPASRPFWTEKSSFIEGDELFVVGVASKARTVEQGRRQAFEQGKVELMNFAQITNLEAQGLVIETQMTFEEPNADGTVTVYRLLRVPASKLVAIQGRLQAQSRAQEQAIEESRKELAVIQQTLGEKATKLDQQQRQVEHVLQQINKTIQSTGTSTNRSEGSVSLVDRLKEADAKLDANEQEVSRLSRQVQERVMSRSLKACQYITPGMNQSEVGKLLGPSDGVSRKVIQEEGNWDSVDTWGYGNSVVIFTTRKVVSGVLGCTR